MITTNDRLMEVVAKLCPVTMARYRKTRAWGEPQAPATPGVPRTFHPRVSAPYRIKGSRGETRVVQVYGEEGDVIGGVGQTVAAAVDQLRSKVGLDKDEE